MKIVAITQDTVNKLSEPIMSIGTVRLVDDDNTIVRQFNIDEYGKTTTALGNEYTAKVAEKIASKFPNIESDYSNKEYDDFDSSDEVVYENDFDSITSSKDIALIINFAINECKHAVIRANEKAINSMIDARAKELKEELDKLNKQKDTYARSFKDNWKSFSTGHQYVYTKQFAKYDINKYVKELKLTKLSDCKNKIKPDTEYTYIECNKDGKCQLGSDDIKECLDKDLFEDISKVYVDLNSGKSNSEEFADRGRSRFDEHMKIWKKYPELDAYGYGQN